MEDFSAKAEIKECEKSKMSQNVADMFPSLRVLVLLYADMHQKFFSAIFASPFCEQYKNE